MLVRFPYGKEYMTYDIPDERLSGISVSESENYLPEDSEENLVKKSLQEPTGSRRLSELSVGKNRVVVIASDHTRPVPSRIIMPLLLEEIRRGNPKADITILIATGCHRETRTEELRDKFGEEIYNSEKIVVHDCDNKEMLVDIGELPSGGRLVVNRLAAEADLVVSEGFIEPHFFAGFSGGRKSVLPGIASRKTVMYNHNASFIDSANARTGNLSGNPIHTDMDFAAKKLGLAFICNVILNQQKKVIYAVSGNPEKAHLRGCEFLRKQCCVSPVRSDIVITTNGGYPLDQNIYQAVKGITTAEAAVKENGVIIMIAKSDDGHGGEAFYKTFREHADIRELMEEFLATPPEKTIVDQWQSQIFARALLHATVIYISNADDRIVRDLHMIPAHSISEAVKKADDILAGSGIVNGTILAIPDGVSVIVS